MPEPTRRDPWVRAAALHAATRWRPWTPGQPESDAIDALFMLADRFAGWIEGDAPEVCLYCGLAINGGPGGWHDELGAEVCDGDSPTSFHEPEETP